MGTATITKDHGNPSRINAQRSTAILLYCFSSLHFNNNLICINTVMTSASFFYVDFCLYHVRYRDKAYFIHNV